MRDFFLKIINEEIDINILESKKPIMKKSLSWKIEINTVNNIEIIADITDGIVSNSSKKDLK